MMKMTTRVNKLLAEHETRDPFVITKNLGIHILRTPLVNVRGFYIQENDVDFIHVSESLDERPAKFVCAHELGHYFLHNGLNRVFMDRYTYMIPNRFEDEADHFAAQLLYSEPPMFDEETMTDYQLADCLNVPVCNVNTRMVELGIYH